LSAARDDSGTVRDLLHGVGGPHSFFATERQTVAQDGQLAPNAVGFDGREALVAVGGDRRWRQPDRFWGTIPVR
jgi:hypothetical protein